jgi:superfamily II DNA or RNA helicase
VTAIKLRDYQLQAIEGLHRAFDGEQRPTGSGSVNRAAVVLPTGAGKTHIFTHPDFWRPVVGDRRRMVVLVHRDELASQTVSKLHAADPTASVGRVQALWDETDRQIIVASVQTLAQNHRRNRIDNVGLVVVDEAHHAVAPTYVRIMEHYGCFATHNPTPTAGFTATMTRTADDEHLGNIWSEIVLQRDVMDGIRGGWLVDIRGKRVEIKGLDLNSVKRSRGDFSESDLGDHLMAADAPDQVAKAYVSQAGDRQGIAFWPDLASADAGAEAFRAHGIATAVIKGETSTVERVAIYDDYRRGRIQMLSSCMVLTEGFDMPQASAAVIARPTQSAGLFVQMAGRVARPWHLPVPGYGLKRDALLLDVVGATTRHRLATIADLSVALKGVKDGQSLAEAMQEKEDLAAGVSAGVDRPPWLAATHTITDVDLFGDRRSVWLQTPAGTWFIPAGDNVVFLWPDREVPGLWMIGVAASGVRHSGKPVASGLTMDWAIERAEWWAGRIVDQASRFSRGRLNSRKAGWRSRQSSPAANNYARSLGIVVPPGADAGHVSDLIATVKATMALGG